MNLLNLYPVKKIQEWDQFTIKNDPISSINLMEKASINFVSWFTRKFDARNKVQIFAGAGNNGGDALAIGRLLRDLNYHVDIFHIQFSSNLSEDCSINLNRLEGEYKTITSIQNINSISAKGDIIIDGLFGSGLTRNLEGDYKSLIEKLNSIQGLKISIDAPSGLFCDELNADDDAIFKADHVVSFQIPKRSFLFPENQERIGQFHLVDIGLSDEYQKTTDSTWKYVIDIDSNKKRSKFSHKGTFGHALLITGSKGKMGAATLCSQAALKSGVGLVTTHVPHDENSILQTASPEGMTSLSKGKSVITDFPDLDKFNTIGIGPGIGKSPETKEMIFNLLKSVNYSIVIDADALNIIAEEKWIELIPENSILTPHPKEFERLFGKTNNSKEALELQVAMSKKHNLYIIKKGAYTSISSPEGMLFFNSTGNPGMATAGSGDVLTGVVASLLAQGYAPQKAAINSVFLHGKAGDNAAKKIGERSLTASDIIKSL